MTSTIASNGASDVVETKGKALSDGSREISERKADLRMNGTCEGEEAMDFDGPVGNGEVAENGGEEDDDDDLSSDIGLIEDEEDLDDLGGKDASLDADDSCLGENDAEMADCDDLPTKEDDQIVEEAPKKETRNPADAQRSASRQSVSSDASIEEIEQPEIVEHVVKLVVNQLVNVVSLKATAYRGANTLKRRREDMNEDDLIDEIEDGDIESRIKCVDILSNRHEQIRLKREQR